MANVKSVIASVRDARIGTRVFASADVTADEMGNTWVNVNVRNAHGMTARECLALDVDNAESMFAAIRHAKRSADDMMHKSIIELNGQELTVDETLWYRLEDVIRRVDERGGIYAANAANNLANKLCNEVVRVMAEAMDSGNALVNNAVRANAMRGAFAALV